MDGFVVTVDGKNGFEHTCTLAPRTVVGTREQADTFMEKFIPAFPKNTYRLYRLERVVT